jgi:hypothetical protein
MGNTTTTTGAGNSAAHIELENTAHMMASFLGQLVDEGILDALGEEVTMGGLIPKVVANRLLDRFDRVAG